MVVTGDTQLQDEDAGVHHKQLPKVASESDTSTDSAPIKSYQPSHEDKEAQAAQQERVRSAVWRHDVFNLVALAVINMMNCYFLASRTGFGVFWHTAMIYFVADFLWIACDQKCVKSVTPLLVHHIVSATYSLLPYFYPEVQEKMCYVMLVEMNTWLLTARRVMPCQAVEVIFYASWVVLRVLFSPYLIWDFWLCYKDAAQRSGNIFHPILSAPVMQIALCAFYTQWTIALIKKLGHKSHQL